MGLTALWGFQCTTVNWEYAILTVSTDIWTFHNMDG